MNYQGTKAQREVKKPRASQMAKGKASTYDKSTYRYMKLLTLGICDLPFDLLFALHRKV
jgi:hypothetical protein